MPLANTQDEQYKPRSDESERQPQYVAVSKGGSEEARTLVVLKIVKDDQDSGKKSKFFTNSTHEMTKIIFDP